MSQHYFSTTYQDRPITVLAGWDRPLSQHFMVIEHDDADDHARDEDAYLYSNLYDHQAWGQDWSYFQRKLDELGIKVPKSLVDQIHVDCAMNVGNRHCVHQADGSYTSDGVFHHPHK